MHNQMPTDKTTIGEPRETGGGDVAGLPPTNADAKRNAKITLIFIAAVLIVAAAIRFYGIGRRSIWYDEAVTLGLVRLPFWDHLRHAWDTNLNNQFVYYLLFRPWHALGEAEETVRAFSALFSVAGVAVVYFLGRRLFGSAAGVVAALALALHAGSIWYAQEARSYALATFFVLLSSLFLVRFIQGGARRDLIAWVAASTLSCYAHFFAGYVVAAQIVSLAALGLQELRQRKALAGAIASVMVLTLPIVITMILTPMDIVNWIPPLSLKGIVDNAEFLSGGNSWLLLFSLAFFVVLTVRIFQTQTKALGRWSTALVLAWSILPPLALAAISVFQPILINRYLMFAVPAWSLSAGGVLGRLMERGRIAMIGACMALGLMISAQVYAFWIYNYVRPPFSEDWRTPAAQVAAATLPGDVIIYDSAWAGLALEYYLDREPQRPRALQAGHFMEEDVSYINEVHLYKRVWMVMSRQDKARCSMIAEELGRNHSFVSWKKYPPNAVIVIVLFDEQQRAHWSGASD